MKVTFDATAHACVRTDKQGQLYIDDTHFEVVILTY